MQVRRSVLAVAGCMLGLTGAAQAATLGYEVSSSPSVGDAVIYNAAPGETNDVELTQDGARDATMTISDPGTPISADPTYPDTPQHCALAIGLATCTSAPYFGPLPPVGSIEFAAIELGDGDDSYRDIDASTFGYFYIGGGPGDDRLFGGADGDALFGGPGADELSGGPNTNDDVSGDYVYYTVSTAGVTVSLDDAANDGIPGEGDNVHSDVENFMGSRFDDTFDGNDIRQFAQGLDGDDVLRGHDGDDWMSGGNGGDRLDGDAGSDRLHGDAGHDTIVGGDGADFLYGDDGNDVIDARDGIKDGQVECGAGRDTVLADALDAPGVSCEHVRVR